VELAQEAGLEVRSGVVVDERFRTSREGVYAIGDVAEFYDPIFRRHRRIEHWSNAAGKSFRTFGDPQGHDSTALEGDFHGERAIYRFKRGGGTVAAVAIGLADDEQDELKSEIRAAAAG
jgi:NADPH-dependent 2,4-dienoyl-CoA reductase/sulfur reductase-like enzyme